MDSKLNLNLETGFQFYFSDKERSKFFISVSKVLAGGDCVVGSKSMVHGVSHAKIVAKEIIDFLK